MPAPTFSSPNAEYDPRWFIWTIVFLVVTGVSLVSYIMLSDTGADDAPTLVKHRTTVQKQK